MRVDYIRVYQDVRHVNIGCNPEGYPTSDYINKSVKLPYYTMIKTTNLLCRHIQAYTDPNLTSWREDYGRPFPKNSFIESCS